MFKRCLICSVCFWICLICLVRWICLIGLCYWHGREALYEFQCSRARAWHSRFKRILRPLPGTVFTTISLRRSAQQQGTKSAHHPTPPPENPCPCASRSWSQLQKVSLGTRCFSLIENCSGAQAWGLPLGIVLGPLRCTSASYGSAMARISSAKQFCAPAGHNHL